MEPNQNYRPMNIQFCLEHNDVRFLQNINLFPRSTRSHSHIMSYDKNWKWEILVLRGKAVQFNYLNQKKSTVGNESECKILVRIYVIVLVVTTVHTNDSFSWISINDSVNTQATHYGKVRLKEVIFPLIIFRDKAFVLYVSIHALYKRIYITENQH